MRMFGGGENSWVHAAQIWLPVRRCEVWCVCCHRQLRVSLSALFPRGKEGQLLKVQAGRIMTDPSSRKEAFKKCRSATFSIDGYNFTIGKPGLSSLIYFLSSPSFLSFLVVPISIGKRQLLSTAVCQYMPLKCTDALQFLPALVL